MRWPLTETEGANRSEPERACDPAGSAGTRDARAAWRGIEIEIRSVISDAIYLDDQSVDAVISSLILCTVADPARVMGEIRRILRPGGRFAFLA